ncbi:MAG: TetR family transcriptional regulator C-terminal domain-containing protein [Paracoccaceae bacterium]|nr:TetR family transcriptional regulator C-terminal domain-containing protein [Paracoccaceae bacterium]
MSGQGDTQSVPRFRRERPDVRRKMLVEAALVCLARDGIGGFTIDRICREAGVSRGLIGHYFGGKDGLLAEVYRGSLYGGVAQRGAGAGQEAEAPEVALMAIVDATFAPDFFDRKMVRVWLALWDEIAGNPALREVHRELYGGYRGRVAEAIAGVAVMRGREVDTAALAQSFVALADGLWLEWSLDETAVDPVRAKAAAVAMLGAHLGPLKV